MTTTATMSCSTRLKSQAGSYTANAYEIAARYRKAWKLAVILRGVGISRELTESVTPEQWITISAAAAVLPPSRETIETVLQLLTDMEQADSKRGNEGKTSRSSE